MEVNDELFTAVWGRIGRHADQTFHQLGGKAFKYTMVGPHVLRPTTTERNLTSAAFRAALERFPVSGPGALQDLQGPSYLYAVLTDPRISVGMW